MKTYFVTVVKVWHKDRWTFDIRVSTLYSAVSAVSVVYAAEVRANNSEEAKAVFALWLAKNKTKDMTVRELVDLT